MKLLPLIAAIFLPLNLHAQTITADTLTAPAHTLIHLAATSSSPVTFSDGTTPLATLTPDSSGQAILGIATLTPGTHTITAATATTTSTPLVITITPLPTSLTLTGSPQTYAGTPITLTSAGLPPFSTGIIALDSTSVPIPGTLTSRLHTFGESITAAPQGYPALLASTLGLTLTNYATPTAQTCDILPTQILPSSLASDPASPTQSSAPLTTLMPGPTGTTTLPGQTFTACLQATLAWLAIPAEYKILAADPSILTTGTWALAPDRMTLRNTSPAATARILITSTGQPVYLWYLLAESLPATLPGTFTLAIDGNPTGTLYPTQPALNPAYALLRLPVPAGLHAIEITVQSGTIGLLAAATPASPALASIHPTVLVTDLPNQNAATQPDQVAAYSSAIAAAVSLLQSDTLDLRLVPTHAYLTGDPAEFLDATRPGPLGQQHLAQAFLNAVANTHLTPSTVFEARPATLTRTFAAPGTYTLQSTYSGDQTYAPAISNLFTLTVLPQASSATTLSTSRTRFTTEDTIAFTAAVTPAAATGTITFYEGTTTLAQLPAPNAMFSTATLSPGLHTLTALYSGDGPDTSSASPPLTIEVDRFSPSLNLVPLPVTQTYATPITLAANISPPNLNPDPTGPIAFTDTFQAPSATTPILSTLGQSSLINGTATFATANLPVGTHTFTATYPGDPRNLPATSPSLTLQVTPIPTATTLTAIPATAPIGTPITLTIQVTPTATGTITLRDATTNTLTTLPLTNATATLTSSALSLGPHTFQATYPGDATTSPSTSTPVAIIVSRIPSTLTLAPLPPPTYTGTPITLTATLTPPDATGTLIFTDTTTTLGQAPIADGTATLALLGLPTGHHNLTVTYPGDSTHAPATGIPISAEVILHPTTLTLTPPSATLPLGTPLTLTASISPATVTGPITLTEAGVPLASSTQQAGTASFILPNLTGGPHTLTATYPGDSSNAPTSSSPVTVTIAPDPTTTFLSLARLAVPSGLPAIVNIRVASPLTSTPVGTVTLHAGTLILATGTLTNAVPGSGYVTLAFPTDTLPLAPYILTATYTGSLADTPSTSTPATLTIVPIPTTATLAITRTQIPYQTPTTLTASITNDITPTQTPTGTVTFYANTTPLATVAIDQIGTATTTFLPALPGAYALTAHFTPSARFAPATASPQLLYATLPIAVSVAPTALTIAPDASAPALVTITPLSGFTGPIALACTSPHAYITCTFDSPPTSISVPITTHIQIHVAPRLTPTTILTLVLPLPLLALRRRRRRYAALFLAPICLFLSGCAEGGNFAQIPPGAYAVTITVTAEGAAVPATIALTIPAVQ